MEMQDVRKNAHKRNIFLNMELRKYEQIYM